MVEAEQDWFRRAREKSKNTGEASLKGWVAKVFDRGALYLVNSREENVTAVPFISPECDGAPTVSPDLFSADASSEEMLRLMKCRFRPCIDLHQGAVKQIVGKTLHDGAEGPVVNFVSPHQPAWFAKKFRADELRGGHVIQLGPGNEEAAREALAAWPGGLQVGGGITVHNAPKWLADGASHVIVTSWLFGDDGSEFQPARARALAQSVGAEHVVIDLSCRRVPSGWAVATNRWQTLTSLLVSPAVLDELAAYCSEFLIHAADVEGLCGGIDRDLVAMLGQWGKRPVTYAGGASSMSDLETIDRLGQGKIDVTVGSALDLFGGQHLRYDDLVNWNRR